MPQNSQPDSTGHAGKEMLGAVVPKKKIDKYEKVFWFQPSRSGERRNISD